MNPRIKLITANVNKARIALNNNVEILDREDIISILENSGLPKGNAMISQCVKFGIVQKHGNNKYTLPEKPVYYQKIQNAIDAYHSEKNAQQKLYRARVKRDITAAKDFLKGHGYRVIGV